MSYYASFQGRVYLGKRDDVWQPHRGSLARQRGRAETLAQDRRAGALREPDRPALARSPHGQAKSATVNLTIEEFTKENLALALYGTAWSAPGPP